MNNNTKIAVVTLFTKEIQEEAELSNINKQLYCDKHNIDFRVYYGRVSDRYPPWDKILAVLHSLPLYDYVIWVDVDAVFNNFNTSFTDIINESPNADLIFCKDIVKMITVNSGVFIVKNTEASKSFLQMVWDMGKHPKTSCDNVKKESYAGWPYEQGAINNLINGGFTEWANIKIHPLHKFNTHPNFKKDDTFIIHYMGSRASQKSQLKIKMFNKLHELNGNSRPVDLNTINPETVLSEMKFNEPTNQKLIKEGNKRQQFNDIDTDISFEVYYKKSDKASFIEIHYNWWYDKNKTPHLSHSFKINDYTITLNSANKGTALLPVEEDTIMETDIFHSYEWYGKHEWSKI